MVEFGLHGDGGDVSWKVYCGNFITVNRLKGSSLYGKLTYRSDDSIDSVDSHEFRSGC